MRFVLISENSVCPFRAGGFRTFNIAKVLKKRGFPVFIISPSKLDKVKGIKVYKTPEPKQGKYFIKLLWDLLHFEFKVISILIKKRKEIDFIILRSSVPAYIAYPFAKLFKKRIILDLTDIQSEYLISKKQGRIKTFIIKNIIKSEYYIIKKFNRIITVSKTMKKLLIKKGISSDKISVVYDGADLSKFKPLKKNPKQIIHHGGISQQDGMDLIPKAAKIILKKHPDAKFYIVGKGPELNFVKNVAKENGVYDSFVFTGWLEFEKMLKILGKSSIGLVTRPNTLPNNTVLTLKLLEYWATATVPVVPKLNAIKEVATQKENALLFEPENFEDLAKKVIELLDNKKLLDKISKGGQKTIKDFDWKKIAGEVVDICFESL